jgi:hypothetical protein
MNSSKIRRIYKIKRINNHMPLDPVAFQIPPSIQILPMSINVIVG